MEEAPNDTLIIQQQKKKKLSSSCGSKRNCYSSCENNLCTLSMVFIVIGIAILLLCLFLSGSGDTETRYNKEARLQQQQQSQIYNKQIQKTLFVKKIMTPHAPKRATSSPILQQQHNKTIPFFHTYECRDKTYFKSSTQVKIETCTYNVASPKHIIRNWRFAKSTPRQKIHWFDIYKNGSFEIQRKGLYKISSKVTFKQIKHYNYSVAIVCSQGNRVDFSEVKKAVSEDGNIVIDSTLCVNVTQSLLLYLGIKERALIYFYPPKTYFTITKLMDEN